MIIRNATKKDIPSIINLIRQMADYHQKIDKYYKAPYYETLGEYLEKSIKSKKTKIIVVEKDKVVVGYFMGAIEKAPNYIVPKRIGKIYDAFIEKRYRGQDTGRKLFNELLKWFKKEKIKHIELTVDARNKLGYKAWKDYGFIDYRLKMRLDL